LLTKTFSLSNFSQAEFNNQIFKHSEFFFFKGVCYFSLNIRKLLWEYFFWFGLLSLSKNGSNYFQYLTRDDYFNLFSLIPHKTQRIFFENFFDLVRSKKHQIACELFENFSNRSERSTSRKLDLSFGLLVIWARYQQNLEKGEKIRIMKAKTKKSWVSH